eukprot:PhM_4_TR8627/c0_g1_i1/m.13577
MSLEDIDDDDDFCPDSPAPISSSPSGSPTSVADKMKELQREKKKEKESKQPRKDDFDGRGGSNRGFVHLSEEQLGTDWYGVLKVPHDATERELKNAYHRRCLDTHPDKDPNRDDGPFKQVVKAYDVLGNPE